MGARASIRVLRGDQYSPTLCQHWGGSEFHEEVRDFVKAIYTFRKGTPKIHKLSDDVKEALQKQFGTKDLELMTRTSEIERIFTLIVMKFGDCGYIGREGDMVDDSDYGCMEIELGEDKPTFNLGGYSHD